LPSFGLGAGSVFVPLAYAVEFALLLAPGYALARILVRRWRFDRAATLLLAYAAAALAGYLVFWCSVWNPLAGRAVAVAWLLAAPTVLWSIRREGLAREEAIALALTFAVGLFYLAVLYLPSTGMPAAQRFFVLRPPDNIIPQLFAERLYQGVDPRHLFGDWLSSDRPPLQTGVQLLIRPAAFAPQYVDRVYEICGAIAQLAWLPATWLLCARAGFSPRQRALVLALAIGSGYFLYNTVYAWPKLLAAAFSVAALVFALPAARADRVASLTSAGICAALALLAHGGAVFFVVPAFVLLSVTRWFALERGLALAFAAAAVLLAPWSAYQRFYDPPGDRLLKMHLAGINDVDPRPAGRAIADAYARTPPGEIVRNKLANVRTVLGAAPLLDSATAAEPGAAVDTWRVREREHVTAALGVANLGWLALPWWLSRRRQTGRAARHSVTALLVLALCSTAFWCLLLWGPGATVTTHGPYALVLILFVVLGAVLAELPAPLPLAIVGLAVADLLVTWIAGSLGDAWRVAPSLDVLMLLLVPAAAAVVALLLVRSAADPDPALGPAASGDRGPTRVERPT
jgi:hypothetical protein